MCDGRGFCLGTRRLDLGDQPGDVRQTSVCRAAGRLPHFDKLKFCKAAEGVPISTN